MTTEQWTDENYYRNLALIGMRALSNAIRLLGLDRESAESLMQTLMKDSEVFLSDDKNKDFLEDLVLELEKNRIELSKLN